MCSNKSTRRVTCVVEFALSVRIVFLVIRRSRAQGEVVPTLVYVLEPTYSFTMEEMRGKGQVQLSSR